MFAEFKNLEKIDLITTDGCASYYPHFLSAQRSLMLFESIKKTALFEQNEITLFGKKIKVPRLEVYFALNGEPYGYSGQMLPIHAFPSYLDELRQEVESQTGYK